MRRIARVAQAFTPGAPVDRLDLFAGRFSQINDVVSAVSQKGRHVGLYGERGVGKTSLANVLAELFDAPDLPDYQAVVVNCNTEDTFVSVWLNVFRELEIDFHGEPSPEDVRYEIARLDHPALIVIDELDRLEDDDSLTLLADAIKTLSDHIVSSTVVLVGVARSIGDLIGEHESIVRALVHVEMPRMSAKELREILEKGCERSEVTVTQEAAAKIAFLSQGLPHYTHLLGLHAAQRVVQDDRHEITVADVSAAIPQAVARHTIQSDYLKATRSPRADNLFPQVLLACALARKNQLGYFTAGAIRDPLEVIAGRRLEIPAFARHLKQFLQIERGSVLQREGEPRRYFYRFSDPIMQPFVILSGLSEGLVTDGQLVQIQGPDSLPDDPDIAVPQRLF
jgi:type II secretory pathway predicted ATPase ExeA